jgi:hypothetical protein
MEQQKTNQNKQCIDRLEFIEAEIKVDKELDDFLECLTEFSLEVKEMKYRANNKHRWW